MLEGTDEWLEEEVIDEVKAIDVGTLAIEYLTDDLSPFVLDGAGSPLWTLLRPPCSMLNAWNMCPWKCGGAGGGGVVQARFGLWVELHSNIFQYYKIPCADAAGEQV